jgi:NADPH:quinone reductase-like Zn-dependent oxidoreductase
VTFKADAWVLHAGDGSRPPKTGKLVRETIEIAPLAPGEVLVEPLYGCWEGNMGHAMSRQPIDICHARGEPKVVIGNAASVRVIACGVGVHTVEPGQLAIIFSCAGYRDRWGYPTKAVAYDAPRSMGCLATKMKLGQGSLIPIPSGTRHSLIQWAAFSLRYITAWGNWRVAFPIFRVQMPERYLPRPNVWGWGGGVTLAELELARREGCHTVMLSSRKERLAAIATKGIVALDRQAFGDLHFDEARFESDRIYRDAYRQAEARFLDEVERQTDGHMVQVFIDYVGTPVQRLTTKALARQGVITTAGWKAGMELRTVRASDCIGRRQYVHTHYARYDEGVEAVAYADKNGWMPTPDAHVYSFDEIPELAENYLAEKFDFFPCYAVNAS